MTYPTNRNLIGRRIIAGREMVDRTNEEGTCLNCGMPLRAGRYPPGRGTYGDNAFCDLRCGYDFGVAMVANGKRLIPYKGEV